MSTELGTTHTTYRSAGIPDDAAEYVPDLTYPASIAVYDKMRADAAVEQAVRGVSLPIRKAGWHVGPNGARDEVVEHIARDLGLPILGQDAPPPRKRARGRVHFSEHLREALLSLIYGHSVFEQVWEQQADGLMHVTRLASRPVHSITKIATDDRGDLTGVEQYVPGASGKAPRYVTIPADRLVFYSHAREGSAWQGRSMLRAAYRHWTIKDRLLRIDAQAAERHGVGVPIIEAAEGATEAEIAELAQLAQSYRAGSASGGALPHGTKLSIVGVTGTLHDTLASIRYQDQQIAATALRTFTTLGTSEHGSRALGETLMDDFILGLQAEAEELAATLNEQLIEPLGDWNWGPDEQLPVVAFTPIGSDPELTSEALGALVTAGLITADDALEYYVRQRFDLPERTTGRGTARPGGTVEAAAGDEETARRVAELIQKIYLGVDVVLTADEARELANRAGANLTGSLPTPEPDTAAVPVEAGGGTPPFPATRTVRAAAVPTTAEDTDAYKELDAAVGELRDDVRDGFADLIDADQLAADFAASGIPEQDSDNRDVLAAVVAAWLLAWLWTKPPRTDTLTAAVDRAATVGYGIGRGVTAGPDGAATVGEIVDAVDALSDTPALDAARDGTAAVVDGIVDTRVTSVTDVLVDAVETGATEAEVVDAVTETVVNDTTVDTVTATETWGGHSDGVVDELTAELDPYNPEAGGRYRYVRQAGACPRCDENAEQDGGVYAVGDVPPNGRPPVHPNCRCVLVPVD